MKLHENIKVQGPRCNGCQCTADDLFLHLPRERDAWNILSAAHRSASLKPFVVDLSQSVTPAAGRTDGRLPTITPGSKLAISSIGRLLCPLEKILLHGFPIHKMKFPPTITDKQLESMGGNTMHLHIVGAAIVMGLALVDWSLPAVDRPCEGPEFTGPQPTGPKSAGPKSARPKSAVRSLGSSPQKKELNKPKKLIGKKWKQSLQQRWSLVPIQKKVKKTRCPKKCLPPQLRALQGTRWG